MVIEVGTSDFNTLAGKEHGIYIEPIKQHYDNLPNCIKENVAISNYNGKATMYYIPNHLIEQHSLPRWVKGCNSIHIPHKSLNEYSKYIHHAEIQVLRMIDIITKYNVNHIDYLKIDTEGHDCIILNDYLDTIDIRPLKIMFEYNVLSNKDSVLELIKRLTTLGYECKECKTDVVCTLV
jgi:FkbM family methyltransferase